MKLFIMILVLISGIFATTQAGINYILSEYLKSNLLAALISFVVGSIGLFIFIFAFKLYPSDTISFGNVPWWAYLGGLLGAFLVTVTIFAVPKLGATTMFALFIAGQMIASIFYDHFGILGYPKHPVSFIRIIGVVFIAVGVGLVKYF
ncbi:DMT family transporter [Desulfothermus okinawensis JCM 13304]